MSEQDQHRYSHGPTGTVGQEAERLVGAVQDWVRQFADDSHIATGAPECTWCPVCQFIAFVRGDRPDVAARVGEVATAFVSALKVAFDTPENTAAPASAPTPDPASPRVHRIDLSDES